MVVGEPDCSGCTTLVLYVDRSLLQSPGSAWLPPLATHPVTPRLFSVVSAAVTSAFRAAM
jgi:hypothetical protein